MRPKLTDSQLVILSAASMRDACSVLPLPPSLSLNKGSAALVLKSLLGRDLVTEVRASPGDEIWREGDDGRWTLRLTHSALQALGVDENIEDASDRRRWERLDVGAEQVKFASGTQREAGLSLVEPTAGTKLATIVGLLRRDEGATLDELMIASGWQAHSVRGAISGTIRKKHRLPVNVLMLEGRGKVYRIEQDATDSKSDEGV